MVERRLSRAAGSLGAAAATGTADPAAQTTAKRHDTKATWSVSTITTGTWFVQGSRQVTAVTTAGAAFLHMSAIFSWPPGNCVLGNTSGMSSIELTAMRM